MKEGGSAARPPAAGNIESGQGMGADAAVASEKGAVYADACYLPAGDRFRHRDVVRGGPPHVGTSYHVPN